MSTYVIGDLHGCYDQFARILDKINYNSALDRIILTGDLVNRGPESLRILNYCMADKNINTVLGNHDLYLLYLISINQGKGILKKVIEAQNSSQIFEWLVNRPLLIKIYNKSLGKSFIISHAGIPEIWSIQKAERLAKEVSIALKENAPYVLQAMWGDKPDRWDDGLTQGERYRTIINYLTRMRFLSESGILDFNNTSSEPKKGFKPWFDYQSKSHQENNQYFIFGHWAALNGQTNDPHFIGLDTGCVWKGNLTALRLEDLKKISVKY